MVFMLRQATNAKENIAEALTKKDLRIYDMRPRVYTDAINWDSISLVKLNRLDYYLPTQWQTLTTDNAPQFSAIAYHFGAMLADSLDIPIGLICNAVGGAPIESFIDRHTLEYHPELVDILTDWRNNDRIQPWVRSRGTQNIKLSANPLQRHPYEPCYLYEAGIAPLAGFPLRGFIWYQGESNAHNVELFASEFPTLVESWRRTWNDDTMPFHFVQLSSINRPSWPHFRDVQRQLAKQTAHCEMAVSSDKGDSLDVHPRDKRPIGERLGRIALHHNYGYTHLEPSGPTIRSAENRGKSIVLTFDHAKEMHAADGTSLKTFEIADEYGLYYPADRIEIKGNTIWLQSKSVKCPTRARYGWQPFTRANLVNAASLPASTFEIQAK
jgi:sialate O-acetylesterase